MRSGALTGGCGEPQSLCSRAGAGGKRSSFACGSASFSYTLPECGSLSFSMCSSFGNKTPDLSPMLGLLCRAVYVTVQVRLAALEVQRHARGWLVRRAHARRQAAAVRIQVKRGVFLRWLHTCWVRRSAWGRNLLLAACRRSGACGRAGSNISWRCTALSRCKQRYGADSAAAAFSRCPLQQDHWKQRHCEDIHQAETLSSNVTS